MVAALPSSYLASFRTSSGSLAILLAIRRASSLVSSLAAERRPVGLKHFQLKFDDPSHASISKLGAVNMNEKESAPKTQAQFLRDAFEGIKGRQPTSDDELNQWLATDEGKAATMFDDTTLSPWGDRGRS